MTPPLRDASRYQLHGLTSEGSRPLVGRGGGGPTMTPVKPSRAASLLLEKRTEVSWWGGQGGQEVTKQITGGMCRDGIDFADNLEMTC